MIAMFIKRIVNPCYKVQTVKRHMGGEGNTAMAKLKAITKVFFSDVLLA